MTVPKSWLRLLSALVASCIAAGSAAAAGKFPEKNIEFIVGYKPGGGYSEWALALAPFIEKHLPNKASVVVRHMDGAGNVTAATYIQKAKADGYTIGIYNMVGLATQQLARPVGYDLNKVTWLARLSVDNGVALVSAKAPYSGIQDFKKQDKPQYITSIRGYSDIYTLAAGVTFEKLGVKWKPLNHEGAASAILAVIRGDADVMFASYESMQQYVNNGDVRAILYYGNTRSPDLPNTPTTHEIGMTDLSESMNAQRMIGAPPGLPPDVRASLETTIKKAIDDPEFQEVMKKMKKTVQYLPGKDAEKIVKSTLDSYKPYVRVVNELMSQGK